MANRIEGGFPKLKVETQPEDKNTIKIEEKQEVLNNLIDFIEEYSKSCSNFKNIEGDLNKIKEMPLENTINFIESKTGSTYSFLQDGDFVEKNFDTLLKIKEKMSLESQKYLIDGIKSIKGGSFDGWEFQKKYIESLGEPTTFQRKLIESNDAGGTGIFSKKYDIPRGFWSDSSPVFFYNINLIKDYTPRQMENYIESHISNHFLHRYNISIDIDEKDDKFLEEINSIIKSEREKNPIISEVIDSGNYIEGEKG